MRSPISSVLVLVALTFGLTQAEAQNKADGEVTVVGKTAVVVTELPFGLSVPESDFYWWDLPPAWSTTVRANQVTVTAAQAGAYTVSCRVATIDWAAKKVVTRTLESNINVGTLPDPGPGPGPGPGPEPQPDPNFPGLHVLFLYETKSPTDLPVGQQKILFGGDVRDHLLAHCAADPDQAQGKAVRWFDPDTKVTQEKKKWVDLRAATSPSSLPWVAIRNSGKAYQGPLPADPAAFLELLKKYE